MIIVHCKGQVISKELFATLEFFQKTNETIRSKYWVLSKKNEFVCSFFGRIVGLKKKHYDFVWPLGKFEIEIFSHTCIIHIVCAMYLKLRGRIREFFVIQKILCLRVNSFRFGNLLTRLWTSAIFLELCLALITKLL